MLDLTVNYYVWQVKEYMENYSGRSPWHEPVGTSYHVLLRFMLHNTNYLELRHIEGENSIGGVGSEFMC